MMDTGGELQNSPNSSNRNEVSEKVVLKLFVIGASPNSTRAITNLSAICEKHLKGSYDLEIIDIYQQPEVAEREQIIALPLLIKKHPGTERRLIGDMSDEGKVLKGLEIIIRQQNS